MTTRKTLHEKPRQRQPEGGADGCATPRRWSPCCRKIAIAVAAAVVCMATVAEPEPARQPVWPEGRIPGPQTNVVKYAPYYMWWAPTNQTTDAIMICCSGGGYHGCGTGGFETRPLVHYLNEKGMNVVEFRYRCPRISKELGPKHLLAWQDAQRMIRIVRHEAKKRGLCPDKIGFTGCSAGGHLTIMAAVSSTTNAYELIGDEVDRESCRLNFAVPVYPAYGMSDKNDCPAPSLDLSIPLVPEFLFDNQTPPMCFFHGDGDDWTPMTSMRCWHRLHSMHVPAELHVLAQEGHCFQYRPRPNTNAASWKDAMWNWMTRLDIVTGHPYRWYCPSCKFIGEAWQFPTRHMAMTNAFEFAKGTWASDDMGGGVFPVKPNADIAIRKPVPKSCEFDVEAQIFSGAATGIVIGNDEIAIPENYCPDGQVCRLTVRRENGMVTAALLCTKPVPAEWIKPAPDNLPDRILFRGKREGEAGYCKFKDPLWRDLCAKRMPDVCPRGDVAGGALTTDAANCLFEDGRSDWRISIREDADLAEVFAAETLQTNILKISGALLPIVREKIPGAPKALVVSPSLPKGPDDLVSMRTAGGCIFLEGNSPRATVYAASRFLQDYLGARWFWPEDDGEYLPRLRRYEIPAIDWSSKPAFRYRDLSQCYYHGHVPTEHWLAKLGMNMGCQSPPTADLFIRVAGGHTIGVEGDKMFAEHPDWFSLVDGRRVKDGISGCWSNPGFTAAMVEKIKNIVRGNRSEILRAFPYDTSLRCQCPECTKNPDPSSRWYDYYAYLVEEVKKEFPGIRVAGVAYQEYGVPPAHPVKGLEWVEYCQYNRCYIHQLGDTNCPMNQKSMEVLGRWREMAPMGVYGYHFDIFAFDNMHFLPFWNMLADEARTYARMGFVRMKTEMPISRPKGAAREKLNHIMFRIPYYVYAQLTWNPDANVDDILRDWCEHVYGAGAAPMHEYLVRFAANWDSMKCHISYVDGKAASIAQNLISPEFLKFAWGRIEAAEAAVKASGGGPDAERALREIGTERALLRQWETTWALSAADRVSYVPPHLVEGKPLEKIPTVSVTDRGDKDRRAPHQPTDIRLWWTDEALRIHVVAHDDDIAGLMAGEPGRDIPFWNHDNVEIFLGLGDGIYRQLGVTPAGGIYDAMGQDASWNPAWTARTAIGEDRWTADITLPFASFCGERPKNGDTWQLSVIRNDKGHRACGFPGPVYRDLALMASVVFSDKARGQRLVWLEPKKGADNRHFMARRPQLYARGWNATCFIGAEEAEKADVESADLIFVGSGQDNLSEKFYRERVIPAVEGGAVLFIDSYYGIGDLQRKFGDETFKVGYRDDSPALRRATWFTTNTFATIPNRIRPGTTPPGVLFPESPESWEILAMSRQKSTGLERPYMMVRPYGKGAVFLTAPLYGELLDCIENAWEYNTVLKRD